VTGIAATVPVAVDDLRVGDVITWSDGRRYAVVTVPVSSSYPQEYAPFRVMIWVTEINPDTTRTPGREKQVHSPDAVLNVLTPRPEK
jgi:hypothetical protein